MSRMETSQWNNRENHGLSQSNKYQAQFYTDAVDAPVLPCPQSSNTSSNSASQRALRSEALRIATFQGWPLDYISPKSLSSAGFFYRGIQDQTQCAFCFITINQWEPHDDPLVEHQRHAPNCPFILKLPVGNIPLTSASTDTTTTSVSSFTLPPLSPVERSQSFPLPPLPRMQRNLGGDTCSRFHNEIRTNASPDTELSSSLNIRTPQDEDITSTTSNLSSLSIHPHLQARNPTLVSQEARMKSFDGWPPGLAQRPLQLASAGFFYMGMSDHVKCFCCNGALRNWEPKDDPWVEHARWFSRCNFLLSVKGEDYVKQIHAQYKDDDPGLGGHTRGNEVNAAQVETKEEEQEEEMKTVPLAEEAAPVKGSEVSNTSNLSEALLCKICYDQQMSIVFLPCGHSLSCPSCATALRNCPLCRKRIDATVRAFFSFS